MNIAILFSKWFLTGYEILGFLAVLYILIKFRSDEVKKIFFTRLLLICAFGLRIVFSLYLTLVQYLTWQQTELTKLFLSLPVEKTLPFAELFNSLGNLTGQNRGYFLYYSFCRFWLANLILFLVIMLIFVAIYSLYRFRGSLATPSVWNICLAAGVVVGWPKLLVYLPLTLLLGLVLGNLLRTREKFAEGLEIAVVLSMAATLLFGGYFVDLTGLWVLSV